MKIARLDAILLSYRLPEPLRLTYFGGERVIYKRDAMLIRLETESGTVGYAPGQGSERAQQIIDRMIAPFLVGRTLADPDALRVQFHSLPVVNLTVSKMYSAVEVALYDALGKKRDLPVSELMGGRVRDHIRLYGSGGMYMPAAEYAAEAKSIAAQGFSAYKLRPGLGPEEDVEIVRQIRESVGPDVEIMVDAHTWWRMGNRSYSAETCEEVARKMAEYEIAWLEEPVPPDDHDALLALRQKGIVPVASGEHEQSEARFLDLIGRECVDFVQMDIVCQGGYGLARRLFAEIARHELKFAFHSWGTQLEVMAAAQVGICWPATVVEWLEYPCHRYQKDGVSRAGMYPFDLAWEILKTPLKVEDGELIVPALPGLGVEVDEAVIDRYPWIPGAWSSFTLIDPPGEWQVTSDHSLPWDDGK
jgi:L-alanine-DL-glutamate epimerase-like enolase superfamily enzyme